MAQVAHAQEHDHDHDHDHDHERDSYKGYSPFIKFCMRNSLTGSRNAKL